MQLRQQLVRMVSSTKLKIQNYTVMDVYNCSTVAKEAISLKHQKALSKRVQFETFEINKFIVNQHTSTASMIT